MLDFAGAFLSSISKAAMKRFREEMFGWVGVCDFD